MKNVLKSVLITLGLIVAVSATDATIHKKMFGSVTRPSDLAKRTTLIAPNDEMNGIMKILKLLE